MITIFILYLLVVAGIAIWTANFSKTKDDFILGGKRISGVSLALSERATGESAWLILGLTGYAYSVGFGAIWVALGCVAGIVFIWLVMSEPLRRETDRTGALTVPGLLSRRFPGTEKPVGILSSLIVIFFFLFYIAAQFSGAGKVFQDTFGLDPFWGMVIGAGLVTLYTMFGGFITVVATDVFQGILMIFTLIVLPVILILTAGHHNIHIIETLKNAGTGGHSVLGGQGGTAALLLVMNGLSWALGYTGQPQLLARMMALKNRKDAVTGQWVASLWTLVAYTGAIIIGVAGFALVKVDALGAGTSRVLKDAEQIFPALVSILVTPVMAGILLSGAVSAMMSTASSELILCSSSMSEDLYGNLTKKLMAQKKLLWMNKLLTLGVGVVAMVMVLMMKHTVYSLVSYAWSGIGSSFGPALLLMLFWKKFSRAGLYASLISGTFGAILWKTFLEAPTGITERLGSYIIAFTLAVLFSLAFPEKKR